MRCINDLEIGARLRDLRLKKNVKMIDTAVEFEVSTAQYSRLENGQGRISIEVLKKACDYYNTSIDFLLFGENNTPGSVFYQKLKNYSEYDRRRMLKILCCLMTIKDKSKYKDNPLYKIFLGGLLEMIPVSATSAIPYVLEYEKNTRKISENRIIKDLGITRFKWNSIMSGSEIRDVTIPLAVSNQYGYDMTFLIRNKIPDSIFFDELISREQPDRQMKIMQIFDSVITIQNQEYLIERQRRRW